MMAGKITGMVSSSMDSSSITQPSSTYSSKTASTTPIPGIGRWVTHCATSLGISVRASVAFIMSAPRKIMNTMAVVSAVPNNAERMPCDDNSRLSRPVSRVSEAPTAAPSVGENRPP